MNEKFLNRLLESHKNSRRMPGREAICNFTDNLFQLLFPAMANNVFQDVSKLKSFHDKIFLDLRHIFTSIADHRETDINKIVDDFMNDLPELYETLMTDAEAITSGDPAAVDINQVIRTYPGFYAIAIYRVAHKFCNLGVPLLPRILTEYAHERTGIDIHPKAKIDEYFCIDHGTGIVIGETTVVGKHVKLYQGVTLGALSVAKEMAKMKRHPTIEDHVVIYAGATILGGNTIIGNHSIIGGNVWVTESIEPYSRVYHKPSIAVRRKEDPENITNFSI